MNEQLVDEVVYHTFSFPCLTGEAKQEECDPRGSTRGCMSGREEWKGKKD